MKNALILACIATLSFGTMMPAMADHDHHDADWYHRYDRDRDGHWNYNELKRAHYDYIREHRDEQRISNRDLRRHFERMSQAHPGYVQREEVEKFHSWH